MKKIKLYPKILIPLLIFFISVPMSASSFFNNFIQLDLDDSDIWVQTNGPYGGIIHTIEVDPNQPNILYAGGAGGVFKSVDSGETWNNLPRFLEGYKRVEKIIISPDNSQILYVNTESPIGPKGGEVFRSDDGGQTWSKIDQNNYLQSVALNQDNPTEVICCTNYISSRNSRGVLFSDNRGGSWVNITGNLLISQFRPWDVAISSEDTYWVGVRNDINGSGSLYLTSDGGISWDSVDIGQPPDTSIRSILVHPDDNNTIYVSLEKAQDKTINPAESYMFKTENGGQSWAELFPPNPVRILGVHPESSYDTVYVAYGNLVYKTSDNGFNWIRIDPLLIPGVSTGDIRDIAINPDDGNDVYLPISSHGYFKSTDEGASWRRITNGFLNVGVVLMAVPNLVGSDTVYVTGWDGEGTFRTDDGGETWVRLDGGGITHSFPDEIKVHPLDPSIIWEISDLGGLFESTNYGTNWTTGFNGHSGYGFRFGSVHALTPAPSDPNVIYAVKSGYGIFKSIDAGINWNFLRHSEVDYTYTLAVHPTNSNIVYSGYNPKPFQDWAMVRKTTDGGDSWTTVLNVTSSKGITSIAFDPIIPDIIYAASISEQGGEIYKSFDAGETWIKLNDNFNMFTVMGQPQLIVDPNNPLIAYTGSWLAGTWKTSDGGVNWELLQNAPNSATAVSLDVQNSNIIYLADRSSPTLWKSTDGGGAWDEIADFSSDGSFLVNTVVANSSTVYCSTFGPSELTGKLYKSTNSGGTWTDITGILPRSVLDLEIDPTNSENVYVTTHLFGAYSSTNGGIDWEELLDFPDIGAFDIEVDPVDPTILYSCGLGNLTIPTWVTPGGYNITGNPGVYKSTNSGENWTQVLVTDHKVRGIRIHPANHEVIFAAVHGEGLLVSSNGGSSWNSYNTNLNSTVLTSIAIHENIIYVGTQGFGVYSGDIDLFDYSVTWQAARSNKPIPPVYSMEIIIDPNDSERIYVSANPGGLYRSDDGGITYYDKNFQTPTFTTYDPYRQGYYSFALNPNNTEEIWLGTWGLGMFKSYDGMDFNVRSLGIGYTMIGKHIYKVAIDPYAPKTVYAATEEGVYRTLDDGNIWSNFSDGLDTLQVRTFIITADGSLFCGTLGYEIYSYNTTLSRWEQLSVFGGFSKVWSIWNDRPLYQYTTLLFHPTDPNIIYVGAFPSGMYKSTDGGVSWKEINVGWTNDGVFSLVFHPDNPDIIYAGTYNGVSRSLDGGEHWEIWDDGWPNEQWTFAIDFDPLNPDIMYACSKNGENEGTGRTNFLGTVMKSINGGATWFPITNGLNLTQEFYQISVDKNDHNIVYLCTQNQGVFITFDGGGSWEMWNDGLTTVFAGTNGNNVAQPMVQTTDGRYIYFGTADSGVFRRKAAGYIVIPEISKTIPLVVLITMPLVLVVSLVKKRKN